MNTISAVFDFDGTLTRGDSLLPFLRYVLGPARFAAAIARTTPVLAGYAGRLVRNDIAKERLLSNAIAGMPMSLLQDAGTAFAADRISAMLNATMMKRLAVHQAIGHRCILASASLDVYLAPFAKAWGFAGLECSRLELDDAGRVTGRLAGGNCHGNEKACRVATRFAKQGMPSFSFGYGDTSGDIAMLRLVNAPYMVVDGRPCSWKERLVERR